MVKEKIKNKETYYLCEECGFYYKTKSLAEKCENFCRKNKSCNLELIKHSVEIN